MNIDHSVKITDDSDKHWMSILKENAIGVIAYNQGHDNQKWHKADSDNTYRMYNTQVLKKSITTITFQVDLYIPSKSSVCFRVLFLLLIYN